MNSLLAGSLYCSDFLTYGKRWQDAISVDPCPKERNFSYSSVRSSKDRAGRTPTKSDR